SQLAGIADSTRFRAPTVARPGQFEWNLQLDGETNDFRLIHVDQRGGDGNSAPQHSCFCSQASDALKCAIKLWAAIRIAGIIQTVTSNDTARSFFRVGQA